MFVDLVTIQISAGRGGDGAVSFHREKYVAAGGPDGGDGGRGGDVLFLADTNLSTLVDFRYQRSFAAQNGEPGRAKNSSGKAGDNLVIRVPRGTLVRDAESGRLLADVSGEEPVKVAAGGRGGWGNQHFATPTRQVPRFAKPGREGERFTVTLELKLLADVGLVGFPNVGKSTLISAVSAAKPKIANYPFTTLAPNLGVVRVGPEQSFVMADIPGLIEGASEGQGLGHAFLRHVERCRLIVHVVDVAGSEGRDSGEDYRKINLELQRFNPELALRPQIVVGNKTDLATDEQIEAFRAFAEAEGRAFFPLCAPIGEGSKELVYAIWHELQKLPDIKIYQPDPAPEVDDKAQSFTVTRDGDVFVVEAAWLQEALRGVNLEEYDSLQYMGRVLQKRGVTDRLEEMGIEEGDTVKLCDIEFEYIR